MYGSIYCAILQYENTMQFPPIKAYTSSLVLEIGIKNKTTRWWGSRSTCTLAPLASNNVQHSQIISNLVVAAAASHSNALFSPRCHRRSPRCICLALPLNVLAHWNRCPVPNGKQVFTMRNTLEESLWMTMALPQHNTARFTTHCEIHTT